MKLKIMSNEEIVARWGAHPTTGNVSVYRSIAQAQLEACEKEATEKEEMWQGYTEMAKLEVARGIFERVEIMFPWITSGVNTITYLALKQSTLKKYGGE